MIDILLIPILLVVVLVMLHAYFGMEILKRGIIFTDLAIAQFAALGSSISLGYFHEEYFYLLTLSFALLCAQTFLGSRSSGHAIIVHKLHSQQNSVPITFGSRFSVKPSERIALCGSIGCPSK